MHLTESFFGPFDLATSKRPCLYKTCQTKKKQGKFSAKKLANLVRHLTEEHGLEKIEGDNKHVIVPATTELPSQFGVLQHEHDVPTPTPTKKQKKSKAPNSTTSHHPRTLDANGDTLLTPDRRATDSSESESDCSESSYSDNEDGEETRATQRDPWCVPVPSRDTLILSFCSHTGAAVRDVVRFLDAVREVEE